MSDPRPRRTPYLPAELPQPALDPLSQGFWDACRAGRLCFQRCSACGTFRHPWGPVCFRCRSDGWRWQEVPGTGSVFSFTWVHHAVTPLLREYVPYNVSVVTIDDAPGVRVVSNVVDADEATLRIGAPVEVVFETVGALAFPRFALGRG
jgi:hypothetical protein